MQPQKATVSSTGLVKILKPPNPHKEKNKLKIKKENG